MKNNLFYCIVFCCLIAILFLIRLFYPTPVDDSKKPFSATSFAESATWQPFTADTFSIALPGLPQHIKEKMPLTNTRESIAYDMYLLQQPVGSTFMLSLIRYPDTYDTSDYKQLLEAVTNEMLSNNSESHLTSSKLGEFLGRPSIDNTIQNANLYIYMRAFIVDKTLYVLTVVDGQEGRAKANFDRSSNSLQLISVKQ